jgi:UDPglucose 6-dehydrogenase
MFRICMVGTGYVGLVSGACLADFGHRVVCVDIDEARLASIRNGVMPIYEPGLKELVARNFSAGRLVFTTDLKSAVEDSLVVFSAVGTPERQDGSCDLSAVFTVAKDVASCMSEYKVFVQKSTVPVGTSELVGRAIRDNLAGPVEFDRVSNPEFLREGSAIEDFMRPNRVVIGVESERARDIMREIYRPLYLLETPIVFTTIRTAELIKYASNAFLATKISFINEIAELCEKVGADVNEVAKAMGLDRRIGPKFLHAGIGYGGSCLPKDVAAIIHTAEDADVPLRVIKAAAEVNRTLMDRLLAKIGAELASFAGATVAVLGVQTEYRRRAGVPRGAAHRPAARRGREGAGV